jgi:hypothetical protein
VDPAIWDVNIFTSTGDTVQQTVRRTQKRLIVSFRPSAKLFKEKTIGSYVLTFESAKVRKGQTFSIHTRLETSEFPLDEHLKRAGGPQ